MHPILRNRCLCLDSYNISPAVSREQELRCIRQAPPTLLTGGHYRCSTLWWPGNEDTWREPQSWKSGLDYFPVRTRRVLPAAISVYHLLGFIFRSFPPRVLFIQSPTVMFLTDRFSNYIFVVKIKVWPFFSQFTLKTKLWLEFFSCKFCSNLCYCN